MYLNGSSPLPSVRIGSYVMLDVTLVELNICGEGLSPGLVSGVADVT
jgi:hypothetical protein